MRRSVTVLRICPRDGTVLRTERWQSGRRRVEVDRCLKCRGLFLDEGEIKLLTGNRRLHNLLRRPAIIDLDSQLKCPDCKEMMEGENAGLVRVDVCLGCFGLWLDAGELQRLQALGRKGIRRLKPAEVGRVLRSRSASPSMREAAAYSLFYRYALLYPNLSTSFRSRR